MSTESVVQRRPSLRRRLLLVLLVPMGILLLLDALITYGVASAYANRVHDRDLSDDAVMLAKMLGDPRLGNQLSPQARFLMEYDREGQSYFQVNSARHGLLAGSARLLPAPPAQPPGSTPHLYDTRLDGHALRAAVVRTPAPDDPTDSLIVTVA
ncbi:MAG: sensor histidine kinase N-terminal domain-containing protein, partial [Rhodanobacter sp.]